MKKTTKLRRLFEGGRIFTIAGGACAIHAKIAEATGFECAAMGGAATCSMIFGMPDAGLVTMTEMVENASRMANAVSIPVISDADQGYGNAINVHRTVQEFLRAGVAGIHIEDQPMPKRAGNVAGKVLVSIEEAEGKIRAAVDAKNELDPDFVIIARCDARRAAGGSLEEVVRRVRAYRKAGADVLYVEQPESLEECRVIRKSFEGPLIVTTGLMKPSPTISQMEDVGCAAVFFSGLMVTAGLRATWDFAHEFRKRGPAAWDELVRAPSKYKMPNMFDLVGFPEVFEWERKYLPAEETRQRYKSSKGNYGPGATKRSKR
jgi:2-methylisocitrate lyase-like PEP mutase family enzyme